MMGRCHVLRKEVVRVDDYTAESTFEYTDMNRIENLIADIYEQFVKSGLVKKGAITEEPVTTWTMYSLPLISDFNRIETNFKKLDIAGTFSNETWYEAKVFDYTDANRYKAKEEELSKLAQNIKDETDYCGCKICGGELHGIY